MDPVAAISSVPVAASSGSFLITPNVGLMIWTLVVFAISLYILSKAVYPRLRDALDSRARRIDESIDAAEKTRQEAQQLLDDYRERLKEARGQADEIVTRARQTAEVHAREASEEARAKHEQAMEQTRRDIEAETRRAIQDIRREVADLTVMATEKVTRKTLDDSDQKRLVEEALGELDFSGISSGAANN